MRKKYAEENPEAKMTEIGKALGVMWKALDEKEKQIYKDYSTKLKEIYTKQLKEYEEKGTFTPEIIPFPGEDTNEEKQENAAKENEVKETKSNEGKGETGDEKNTTEEAQNGVDDVKQKDKTAGKVELEESKEKKDEETKKDDNNKTEEIKESNTAKEESKNDETKKNETDKETKG